MRFHRTSRGARDPHPTIPPALRRVCSRKRCEACGAVYGEITKQNGRYLVPSECLDHIFARRYLRKWKQEPHKSLNLVSVCGSCHGGKKVAEDHLFAGDILYFCSWILRKHWPLAKVIRAARHYDLSAVYTRLEVVAPLQDWRPNARNKHRPEGSNYDEGTVSPSPKVRPLVPLEASRTDRRRGHKGDRDRHRSRTRLHPGGDQWP